MVRTMVRTDATAPSVKEIFSELDRMRATQVKPEELAMAKETEVRGLTGTFETSSATTGTMLGLYVYNLPLDYYRALPQKIEAVNAAEVQRVAQQYLMPDKMVVVAVGDRSKIQSELQKLNLGALKVLDTEGNPPAAKPAPPKK
jgi:zinc protease